MLTEVVLENAPIQLIARRREIAARAKLCDLIEIVTTFGEEEPEAKLLELMLREVLLQSEHGVEVVGADLDRRFAHLVSRLRYRMLATFQHQDVEVLQLAPQLNREGEPREASTQNDDIVSVAHVF